MGYGLYYAVVHDLFGVCSMSPQPPADSPRPFAFLLGGGLVWFLTLTPSCTLREARTLELAVQVEEQPDTSVSQGYGPVWMDGSAQMSGWSNQVSPGLAFFSQSGVSVALPLDIKFRQTCNAAELQVAVRASEIFGYGLGLLCTDAQYGFLRATTGATRHWKGRGWAGSIPPLGTILEELDKPRRTVRLPKVLSHVHLYGNTQADSLANLG